MSLHVRISRTLNCWLFLKPNWTHEHWDIVRTTGSVWSSKKIVILFCTGAKLTKVYSSWCRILLFFPLARNWSVCVWFLSHVNQASRGKVKFKSGTKTDLHWKQNLKLSHTQKSPSCFKKVFFLYSLTKPLELTNNFWSEVFTRDIG